MISNREAWIRTVEAVRRTATAKGRASSGFFSIEGLRLHERAVRAGWQVESALIGRSLLKDKSPRIHTLVHVLEESGSMMVSVPDEIAAELTDGRDLGAIIGLLRIPQSPLLDKVVSVASDIPGVLLVAVNIKDPGNIGALMRTALAGGATGFVACGISDPYHPKALRTSMGSLFKLPVLSYSDTGVFLAELAALGIQSLGLAVEGAVSLPAADLSENGVAFLLGSESWGLDAETQEMVDALVSIPISEGVDSYSVNAAAAIALYELGRRQGFRHTVVESRA
jgi:TrmH family RNA methyltransferase